MGFRPLRADEIAPAETNSVPSGIDMSPPQFDSSGAISIPIQQPKTFRPLTPEEVTPIAPLSFGESMTGQAIDLADKMSMVGIGDEAVAGGSALLDQLPKLLGGTGQSLSDAYAARLQQARDLQKRYQQENPIAALAGIIPSLRVPIKVLGGLSKTKGVLPALGNIGKTAGTGFALGGAYGFGSGEGGFDKRLENAVQMAEAGAATGGVIQGAGEALQGGSRIFGNLARRIDKELVGFNPEKATKKKLRVNAQGLAEKDRLLQVANAGKDDVRFKELIDSGFDKQIKITDTPASISEKLTKFNQAAGQDLGSTVDELAQLESKMLPPNKPTSPAVTGPVPAQPPTNPGKMKFNSGFSFESQPPPRVVKAAPNPEFTMRNPASAPITKAAASIAQAEPDLSDALLHANRIFKTDPGMGRQLIKHVKYAINAWNKSDKSLRALKQIQETYGKLNKRAFGNLADTYKSELNQIIYSSLAQGLEKRVGAIAEAAGRPELAKKFSDANRAYRSSIHFDQRAFDASRVGTGTRVGKLFNITELGKNALLGATYGLHSPFAILPAAERGYSLFKAVAPVQLGKLNKAVSKTLGAASKLNPIEKKHGVAALFALSKTGKENEAHATDLPRRKMEDTNAKAVIEEVKKDPYYNALAATESNFNPNAKNPTSTAKGLFQFIDSTAKAMGLKNPFDAKASFEAVKKLTEAHKKRFGDDPEVLYAAHVLGAGLVQKYINGDPLSDREEKLVTYFEKEALPNFYRNYKAEVKQA